MTAGDRWRADLEAWAIPDELLAAVDESPYGWPQSMWKRRSEVAKQHSAPTRTHELVDGLLDEDGVLLDIGAGRGRVSLPLITGGRRLIAVERSPEMLAGLVEDSAGAGVEVEIVEGTWPDVAVGSADVVVSANVVYDVQDLGPFLRAASEHATKAVFIEATERHPWAGLAPHYLALHGLERPDGPTLDDLAAVVAEEVGIVPTIEHWERHGGLYYESWDELLEFMGRRLVLPPGRRPELRRLLEPEVTEHDGRLWGGSVDRRMATVWWRV